jgi:hypothetical protein
MKLIPLFLSLLIIFWACNTEDEVTPIITNVEVEDLIKPDTVLVVSVTVDPSYQTSQTEDWIIISTGSGNLLGWGHFESGDRFDIKAFINTKPSFVTVTVLQVLETATRTTFNLRSYAHIKLGENWQLSRLIEDKRNSLGTIDIIIQNSPRPSYAYFQASDNLGGQSYSSSYNLGTTTINFNLFEGVSKIGVTISTLTQEIKYLEIEDPVPVGNYTFDFLNDFISPDHEALISLGSNVYASAMIRGLPDLKYDKNLQLKGLALTEAGYLDGIDQIPLGYNNGFPYYFTELNVDKENYQYLYEKLGAAPALGNISIPANPVHIDNNTFSAFSISGGAAYTHLQNLWNYTDNTGGRENVLEWLVYCPRGAYPVLNELPEDILSEYPFLDFKHDLMNLDYVKVFRNFADYNYEDMIGELIKNHEDDYSTHEYEIITIPN